jgi:hypothetical protein
MGERVNTVVCSFHVRSPKTSEYCIHEWINVDLGLADEHLRIIQIDGPRRKIYMKFIFEDKMYDLLKRTGRTKEFKHESG